MPDQSTLRGEYAEAAGAEGRIGGYRKKIAISAFRDVGIIAAIFGLLATVGPKDHNTHGAQDGVGYGEQQENAAIEARRHPPAFR